MIINIRGTSGSGKSTIVRDIMRRYSNKSRVTEEGRRQPVGYICTRGARPLAVIGHYETDCGGCDTIPTMERIFDLVRKAHSDGMDVVFEGLLISADVNRTAALHEAGLPINVVALTTPLQTCIDSVNERRHNAWRRRCESIEQANQALPPGRRPRPLPEPRGPVKERNTTSKHKGVEKSVRHLQERGLRCVWLDRDGALEECLRLLGIE